MIMALGMKYYSLISHSNGTDRVDMYTLSKIHAASVGRESDR